MPNWIYPAVIIANTPFYYGLYRLFFQDLDEFLQAIFYWFKPDMWSWLDGEFMEDFWAELKLGLFFALCSALVYIEIQILSSLWT